MINLLVTDDMGPHGLFVDFDPERIDACETLHLDFTSSSSIRPEVLLAATLLVVASVQAGVSATVTLPTNYKARKYLEDLDWAQFLSQNFRQGSQLLPCKLGSALPIWRVSAQYMDDYLSQAKGFYQSLAPKKDWSGFETTFRELINNVYDHAASEVGAYVFLQFLEEKGCLQMAVGDFGVGLTHRIRQAIGQNASSTQAIVWAFSEGKSTRSVPTNRGVGLSNVLGFVSSIGGELRGYVADAEFEIAQGKQAFWARNGNLKGTHYVVTLDPNSLPDLEFDLNFDFDF